MIMSSFSIFCLLILADVILGRPVGHLLKKVYNVDWLDKWNKLLGRDCENLKEYALRVGRGTARPVVTFYYVMRSSETTAMEKILIFAAIAYVLSPTLVSKQVFNRLGIIDDTIAITYVLNKVSDRVTPAVSSQVEAILDQWFGTEVVTITNQ